METKHQPILIAALIASLIISVLSGCGQTGEDAADLIVYGTIYTANENGDFAEAIAVRDGKYIYAGDSEGVKKYQGSGTEVVNTGFVMPSAVESHAHYILEEAFKQGLYIDCYNEDGSYKSTGDMVQEIVAYRDEHPELDGIYGYGWNKYLIYYMDTEVTREMIDEYISDIPVYISGRDLHCGWANTKCLEMAGALDEEIPAKGVVRDGDGVAIGRINDEACSYVRNAVFGEIPGYYEGLLKAQDILLSEGYTMLFDPWSNFDGTTAMFDAVKDADDNGELKMAVFTSYCVGTFDNYDEEIEKAKVLRKTVKSDHADARFIKLFCDGTEESMTAYMLEPYYDGTYGTDNWDPERMNYVTAAANAAGLLVHTHAYGDAAAKQTVDAYEKSNIQNGGIYRNSIAHAPYIADSDMRRIADLGIGISGSGDWAVGLGSEDDVLLMETILGQQRYRDYYFVDKWVEYGIKAGMSTDRPCADGFSEDVFDYIGVLTTGVDYREGKETPPRRDGWATVEDAIRMMTINGAWSLDADAERGSIEVGKYADFIFADGNPFETELPEIQAISVTDTYFEGKCVYSK